ncbi:urea ABC transporter ATP-binding protein UrtD [Shinella yambaruensis]|uniref:ABC transporter ATP-binding protein n=1 Tax=Shinella yambaruensis TaxID=415996 RepID=A0ABQ5ZSR7_9HYPH|nr:urea ABC transporter ATP-binding protein UrtD [Shinella yambaruensis]MCJ8026706.1 urea ABC transporter ATP-binding protein UrtD [Shinella yambaruensis]MCU7983626.1 urea ABC transporter ATP-binding protein UrtD [Shinella yambaruensis]GLR54972.1 ABC transporter ATP-binding protein [Shinella yambaruensis]
MTPARDQLLALKQVTVAFSGFIAVDRLDFEVASGELRCLIGPNGAGKSTTLDLICGKSRITSGEIAFRGAPIHVLKEFRIARTGIGRKFQVPSVFRELTVRENLEIGCSRDPGVWRNLFRFTGGVDTERLERLAVLVGLEDHLETQAAQLSHGQTQWLEIALILAQDPALILMDEPTAGMTAQETNMTAELFNRLRGKHTLVVVEHDMGFVRDIAETISVMHQGKLLAQGTADEVSQDAKVREAYLGSGGIGHA